MKQCEHCLERNFRFEDNNTKTICLNCGRVVDLKKVSNKIVFCNFCGKQIYKCGIKKHKEYCSKEER
jgi:ribosomal protein S27E